MVWCSLGPDTSNFYGRGASIPTRLGEILRIWLVKLWLSGGFLAMHYSSGCLGGGGGVVLMREICWYHGMISSFS